MILIILIVILIALIACVAIFVHKINKNTPEKPPVEIAADCCGAHAVCERDTLLSQTDKIIYFDDEELDQLKGIPSSEFTKEQADMIEEVFFSLREQDVAGWLRSIQLRGIELPVYIRDQAILIISERREKTLENWNAKHMTEK